MSVEKVAVTDKRTVEKVSEVANVGTMVLLAAGLAAGYWDKEREAALYCLDKNMYEEAGGERQQGREAVGLVTMLRLLSKQYPDTVCGVVYQPREFSWTFEGKKLTREIPPHLLPQIHTISERLWEKRANPKALADMAHQMGLTRDTYFYKHISLNENDPKEKRMSEQNKWFFRECLQPVLDKDGAPRVIGIHKFYMPKPVICAGYPEVPTMRLPPKDPRRPRGGNTIG